MITGGGGGSSTPAFAFGTAAARPAAAAANANTGYYATDTGEATFSDGAAWHVIQQISGNLNLTGATGLLLANGAGAKGNTSNQGFTGDNNGNTFPIGITINGSGGGTTHGLDISHAGWGLLVAEGSNAKQGTATLTAGSVVVANTSVTASSRIFLTGQADGGTPGWLRVSARTAGTSFTVTSSSGSDTSTFAYEIFEPG